MNDYFTFISASNNRKIVKCYVAAALGADCFVSKVYGKGLTSFLNITSKSNSSYDRVVRASFSETEDSGVIPSRVKPITLKLVFTASLFDAQFQRDSVESKPTSLLVVPLR